MCEGPKKGCGCGCEVRGFIQPRLLLLLAKKPSHGYELMEALRAIPGAESSADPGMLYRTLRQLEEAGAVRSAWDTGGRGPARRVYELADVGLEQLETWVGDVRKTRDQLEGFVREYEALFKRPTKKKNKGE